jgi:LacI family transcriptional regulator
VSGPEDSWATRQRLAGLASFTGEDLEILPIGSVAPTFDGGVLAADLVLATPATAVLAYNDLVAMGLLHRLAGRGVIVPDRLSVVGYDDVSLAAMSHPPLTSVAVPKDRAGAIGLDLLLGRAGSMTAAQGAEVILPTTLVVRTSSGEPTT